MASDDERQELVTDKFDDDIHEVSSHTADFRTGLAEELARLAPEAVADGKIDIEKLRELLDEDAINDGRERFGLMWPGKSSALKAAQAPTTATLVPNRENSKDWDTTQNVFIEGDNLEVLKLLQKRYHGKIKMIYIDPPYNTGGDFIYPDNYKDSLRIYLDWTRQVSEHGLKLSSNPESAGRYHSNWLNMMYPRLKLARNLLSEDGIIAISIDDNEQSRLVQLCEEVFGSSNFVAKVVTQANKGGRDYLPLAQTHEYMVLFAKNFAEAGFFEVQKDAKSLPLKDAKGPYEVRELRNRNPRFNRANRPNLFYPFFVDPKNVDANGYASVQLARDDKHSVEVLPRNSQGKDGCWRWGGPKASEALVPNNPNESQLVAKETRNGTWNVYEKNRKSTTKAKTIWDETEMRTEAGTREVRRLMGAAMFDHPKSVELVKKILMITTEPGGSDLVLDFFAGSGTTAQAIFQLNAEDYGQRKFILVQLPEPTSEGSEASAAGFSDIVGVARQRIHLAGEDCIRNSAEVLSSETTSPDIGFRTYRLADTNFVKWRETSATEQSALEERLAGLRGSADDEASSEMLLTELLVKNGYSLTESVSETEVAGLRVWSVADGAMLAIVDEHVKPSLEQLRAVVEAGPVRLVILEDVFAGDDQLKTNLVQHAKTHGVELWSA